MLWSPSITHCLSEISANPSDRYVKWEPGANPACEAGGNCSSGIVIGLLVLITFAAYWITEWLKNTIHTIISGVYGSWFFAPRNPPKGATRGAARRALTYSFGSISFGSLLVAIINMLRQLCSIAQQSSANSGNFATDCAFCILQCFLGILDWAVQFINRYAFSYIALYGKSYIQSAKDIWVSRPQEQFQSTNANGFTAPNQRSRNRRSCKRMPHRPCPDDGRFLRCVRWRANGLPLSGLHRSGLQF